MLSWCLLTKISASELRRKFNKSALLVGEAEVERKERKESGSAEGRKNGEE